jgi:lipoprotein-anchoring transpeptidase ErfK/SrfK
VTLATASIISGGTAVALQVGSSGPPTSHHAARPTHVRHAPRHKANVTSAPIIIPPAPSTTTTVPPPATTSTGTSGGVRYGSGPKTHFAGNVAPPTINGTPTNIDDPSVVATATVRSLPLYSSPGAPKPSSSLVNPNNLGAALTLLVTGYQDGWVQAYIPVRPNESTAWIPANDVSISYAPDHIVVSLSARTLTLYHLNTAVFETPVAPGAPSSPTPTGSYFVAYIVKLTDPGGPYGPYALGTSDFSNTYFSFEGGPGQVGIHGTDQPRVIGTYASHGCVRLPNAAITTVAQQIVPGTPVEIFR